MGEMPVEQTTSMMASNSDDLLRIFLSDRDVLCPQCGYNLRTLQGNICPECGERIELRVGLVEPRQAAPIVGLIGLSAGAGMNGLLLIYFILAWARLNRQPVIKKFLICNLVEFLVLGGPLCLWLINWRRIRRLPQRWRWTLAILCWALAIVDVVVFFEVVGP